jgi:hypothetical protein
MLGEERNPEPQHARLAAPDAAHPLDRLVLVGEQPPGLAEQLAAGLGELHAAPRPNEQLHVERPLEPRDRLRECRLADVQARRRPPEVQLLGHSHEVAKVPEVDGGVEVGGSGLADQSGARVEQLELRSDKRVCGHGVSFPAARSLVSGLIRSAYHRPPDPYWTDGPRAAFLRRGLGGRTDPNRRTRERRTQ